MRIELDVINGKISACSSCASVCEYQCCKQRRPSSDGVLDPSNSILLYPGELETVTRGRDHIEITAEQFHGGKLGFCNPLVIDQSLCDPAKNFKPLDCRSYPFFPSIVNDQLRLIRSTDCPLNTKNEPNFDSHYFQVLRMWKSLIDSNPDVKTWISSFGLPDYEPYTPAVKKEEKDA